MMRVLYVDADTVFHSVLSKGFVEMGVPLELHYCKNAQDAMAYLSRAVVDVVVSGPRVPGTKQSSLLQDVREYYPAVLRFIIAGEKKSDLVSQSTNSAHQAFSKDTSAPELYKMMQAAMVQLGRIKEERVSRALSRLEKLPNRNAMMTDFLSLLSGQTPSLDSISSTVSKHPGMVAKVIKTANSPVFGQSGRVGSLEEAVGILGIDMIATLFFSMQLVTMDAPPKESRLDVETLWSHCVTTSAIVRKLGLKLRIPSLIVKEAMTAALLHDLGKVVLAHAMPTEFAAACTRSAADSIPLWQAEKPILGNTHAEVGACLLRIWGFPATLVDCVGAHHTPHRLGEAVGKSVLLLHMADAVAHAEEALGCPVFVDTAYLESVNQRTDLAYWVGIGSVAS